jgi:hypothetical protein
MALVRGGAGDAGADTFAILTHVAGRAGVAIIACRTVRQRRIGALACVRIALAQVVALI